MTARAIVLLMLAMATLFAAINVGVGWLYALAFLFLAYFFTAYATSTRTLRGLQVSLHPAERAEAGKALLCSVSLVAKDDHAHRFLSLLARPLGTRSLNRFFRNRLVPEGWNQRFIEILEPGPGSTETLMFPTPKRGVFLLPPLIVQVPALGLGAIHRSFGGGEEVLVHPRIHPLPHLPWFDPALSLDPRDRATSLSRGTDLIRSVRDYRSGDAQKAIHWRSSAKTGVLKVKEFEGEVGHGTWTLGLDLGPGHTEASFEHALSLAASLCVYAHFHGFILKLHAQQGEPAVQTLEAQLDWLARLSGPLEKEWDEESSFLVTANEGAIAQRGIYVGNGRVPRGFISCPPGSDVATALGAFHV